jgi:hypothetical protein
MYTDYNPHWIEKSKGIGMYEKLLINYKGDSTLCWDLD